MLDPLSLSPSCDQGFPSGIPDYNLLMASSQWSVELIWTWANVWQDYCDSPEWEKFIRFLFVWQIHERLQTVTYFDHKRTLPTPILGSRYHIYVCLCLCFSIWFYFIWCHKNKVKCLVCQLISGSEFGMQPRGQELWLPVMLAKKDGSASIPHFKSSSCLVIFTFKFWFPVSVRYERQHPAVLVRLFVTEEGKSSEIV